MKNNKVVYRTKRTGGRKQGVVATTTKATLRRIKNFQKSFDEGKKINDNRTKQYDDDINDYGFSKLPPNVKAKHNEIVNKLQL